MTALYPHRFEVELVSDHGVRAVLSSPPRRDIAGGPPRELGGRDDVWSPEHLLVAATVLCAMSTFREAASREPLALHHCRCHGEGTVDRSSEGPAFTAIRLRFQLRVDRGDVSRATAMLDNVKRHCLVTSILKCPVVVESDITAA